MAFWLIASGGRLTSYRHDVEIAGWLPGLVTVDSTWFPGQDAAGCGSEFCFYILVWPLFVRILSISAPT